MRPCISAQFERTDISEPCMKDIMALRLPLVAIDRELKAMNLKDCDCILV